MSEDLYKVLGVARDADADTLKRAFRKLAKKWHPDRNADKPDAEKRFKEVNRAYEVLSDPARRKAFDEFGAGSLQSGFDADRARAARGGPGRPSGGFGADREVSMEDLLGQMFSRARGRTRGVDPTGGVGFGFEGQDDGDTARSTRHASLEVDFRTASLGGDRELRFEDGRTLKVRIPPGVRDGETIRLPGEDLLLTLTIASHAVFRREGEDLHVTVPITVGEAVRGASVTVPTLDAAVKVVIPPSTQTGRRLRIRGKGVVRRGRAPGDLYVEVEVRVPEALDDAALQAVEQAYGGDVRLDLLRKAAA